MLAEDLHARVNKRRVLTKFEFPIVDLVLAGHAKSVVRCKYHLSVVEFTH
jgi:hypothetical protein